jgi:hypothetical protein
MPCFCVGLCLCTAATVVSSFVGFYVYEHHIKCWEETEEEKKSKKQRIEDAVMMDTIYFDKQPMSCK